jgi:hypothetical protein
MRLDNVVIEAVVISVSRHPGGAQIMELQRFELDEPWYPEDDQVDVEIGAGVTVSRTA